MNNDSKVGWVIFLIYAVFALAWVINLVKLFNCDFEPSYKEEIIHTVGVVVAPTAIITVWY